MNALATPAAVAPAHRVYNILLSKKGAVETALAKLAKKCERKNLGPFAWSWGKAFTETRTVRMLVVDAPEGAKKLPGILSGGMGDFEITTSRIPLTLETARPHYAGWTFIATLQHLDGENIVRSIPGCVVHSDCRDLPELAKACIGGDLPEVYRTRGPVCEHCNLSRRRNDTYVLRHDTGKYAQVGSTCIADFLGSDEAESIAAKAEILALAASCAVSGEEGYGSGGASAESPLDTYLEIVAWCVRTIGWTSRTAAREDSRGIATADIALSILYSPVARANAGYVREEADVAHALAAAAWSEAITDDMIASQTGDYLHNLRAVARMGLISHRTAGIAASMVTAYERALGRERAKAERDAAPKLNEHLGSVGERVSFGLAQETNKRTGAPKKGAPLAIDTSPLTLDFVTGYDTEFGYMSVMKFRTAAGATVVWKTTSAELGRADVGKRFTLVGAVKKHDDYKGEKQTVMSRCAVTEVVSS